MSSVMRRVGWGVRAGVAAGVLLASAGPAPAQDDAKPKGAAQVQTLLVMEKADLSQFMTDQKDKRFAAALGMVPARLRDLPAEVGAPAEPVEVANTLLAALARPGRMAITVNAGNPADGLFGYGVVLSSSCKDQQEAEAMHARVKGALANANMPPPPPGPKRFESMQDVTIPGGIGRLSFGPRKATDGWRYEIIVGTLENPDTAWANLRKPAVKGMTPLLHGVIDLSGLTPAANMIATFAGPQNPQVVQMVREAGQSGLYGADAMRIAFEIGNADNESRGVMTVENAAKYRDKLGMSAGELTASEINAVPADAVMASVSKADLGVFERLIDKVKEQGKGDEVEHVLTEFKAHTGVDLRADILQTLGGTIAYYLSDSTGGGSAGSLVGMISYKDRPKFMEAHAKLVKWANEAAAKAPDPGKYARLASWTEAGVELVSLRLSGLPIPLELTYATTEKWLIAGFTPQATIAAALQAGGKGNKGILTREGVSGPTKGHKLTAFSYVDTARTIKIGYPILSMVGSAVASGVRSPVFATGAARDPGMIVPLYNDLAKDVRPSVMVSYWDGDSYVVDSRGDRSVLVGVASGIGTLIDVLPALAVPIGAVGAAAEHHKQHNQQQPGDADDASASAIRSLRMVPAWASPELAGWALRADPFVTAAALDAMGVREWGAGLVHGAP